MLFHHDMIDWIQVMGYAGVVAIIFVETGLFVFFLPGDSLLFATGLLASQGVFNLWSLMTMSYIAAVLGYFLAYWLGRKVGRWLLKRGDSFWFKQRYIEEAHIFYQKHGGKALILGRLMPIIRSFVPLVAGMVEMSGVRYAVYNFLGAVVWVIGLMLAGFYFGQRIPGLEEHLLLVVLSIIVISLLPVFWKMLSALVKQVQLP